uniref:Uncharacterized protein n=1 Tax=Panagrolaimus sp. JU765 TaxID=591449 RepID=A0AC34RAR4_9BILA
MLTIFSLGDKYTYWFNKCPYENRVMVECSNGKINPNAIIEITEYDDWSLENDHLARFKWKKSADDRKSAYVDIYIAPEQLTDLYRDPWLEI